MRVCGERRGVCSPKHIYCAANFEPHLLCVCAGVEMRSGAVCTRETARITITSNYSGWYFLHILGFSLTPKTWHKLWSVFSAWGMKIYTVRGFKFKYKCVFLEKFIPSIGLSKIVFRLLFYVAYRHLKPSNECESSLFKSKKRYLKSTFST